MIVVVLAVAVKSVHASVAVDDHNGSESWIECRFPLQGSF